jgi:hypothetical protein
MDEPVTTLAGRPFWGALQQWRPLLSDLPSSLRPAWVLLFGKLDDLAIVPFRRNADLHIKATITGDFRGTL